MKSTSHPSRAFWLAGLLALCGLFGLLAAPAPAEAAPQAQIYYSTPTPDADGRIVESLPMHAAGRIDTLVPRAHAPTLFARYGNILPVGFALLLLALAIAFRRRGR